MDKKDWKPKIGGKFYWIGRNILKSLKKKTKR